MTRKHFNKLAAELAANRPPKGTKQYAGWMSAVAAVCDASQEINFRFDRGRFIEACHEGE